jgi:hypothetical protein
MTLNDLSLPAAGSFSVFSTDNAPLAVPKDRIIKLVKKPSLFNVITGPRGSLKTLLLTALACRALVKCFYMRRFGIVRHVWTNYPIGFYHTSMLDGKVYYLKPEPLNMEALYTFDEGLASGRVFIDEIDQWYDRQDWAAVTQKLTNAVITQIRKRELSLDATTQNFQWLNARAQFQTDTLINCREAAFTSWGRKVGVRMGEISFMTLKDLSGVNTGYRYDENFRIYSTKLVGGSRYWDCYDTNYQFDPNETKARYKIKTEAKTITLGEGGYKVQQEEGEEMRSRYQNPERALFSHVITELKDKGFNEVPLAWVLSRAYNLGYEGNNRHAGEVISSLGFARNNSTRLYDISSVGTGMQAADMGSLTNKNSPSTQSNNIVNNPRTIDKVVRGSKGRFERKS